MSLPIELIGHIVGFVTDTKTLLSLTITSHLLRLEAERSIYRRFDKHYLRLQLSFFNRVISCSRVASYVLECVVSPLPPASEPDNFLTLVRDALRNMVNLSEFRFGTYLDPPSAHILRDCTIQLDHLFWASTRDEVELSAFLAGQTRLSRLELMGWSAHAPDLPSHILPELKMLAGNFGTVKAFLPGRRITSLHWQPDDVDDNVPPDFSLTPLLAPLSNLTLLVLGWFSLSWRPAVHSIAPYLTQLKFLHIINYPLAELNGVETLPALEILVLSLGQIKLDLFGRLFNAIKSLRFIDKQKESVYPPEFCRWYRGSTDAVPYTCPPVDQERWWEPTTWERIDALGPLYRHH